ncbi:unnamed protein product [Parascedosporium putredinis]|uniref:VOC domain-containing protein n=1 Tax=Parascedosporium putredinis TaxID=1442378 RepID=A0A9P1H8D0_9PEZI|nr:unnamed protein product [Parascedosporium putredinis]CAI8000634.1 unnamed protein product [Parascedosporium putredinis]
MPLSPEDQRIRILRTAYVIYYHSNLDKIRKFYEDFGLAIAEERQDEIFFKGYGTEPLSTWPGGRRTGGAGSAAARTSAIEKLDGPGGGEVVTLTDPIGFNVLLVHGQTPKEAETPEQPRLVVNYGDAKPRKGEFHRFKKGAAPVHRWGHYGVTYPEGRYQDMYDWYTKTLALAPSDVVYKDGEPICCFFHIDRDLEYTDHHAFFFKPCKPGAEPAVAHSAFEVHDFDVQQLGHQYLESQGHELCWGVGRHVLGSQVFDYWFDTSKFIVEHYADGDLVNSKTEVSTVQAGPDALAIWGPPVPPVF